MEFITNFFSGLQQMRCLPDTTLALTLTEISGQLVVTVLPKMKVQDPTADQIAPICLKGSYQELDEGFFKLLTKPLTQVQGLAVELSQFEASQKKAQAENAKAKKEKEEREKKKKKADELLKMAKELAEKKKGEESISTCQQAIDLLPDYSKATKQLSELKKQFGIYRAANRPQVDLFASEKKTQASVEPKSLTQAKPMVTSSPLSTNEPKPDSPVVQQTVGEDKNDGEALPDWMKDEAELAADQSPLNTPRSYFNK